MQREGNHTSFVAARCFIVSVALLIVVSGMNMLTPCPVVVDCMVGLMIFVGAVWTVMAVDNSIKIASLNSRRT